MYGCICYLNIHGEHMVYCNACRHIGRCNLCNHELSVKKCVETLEHVCHCNHCRNMITTKLIIAEGFVTYEKHVCNEMKTAFDDTNKIKTYFWKMDISKK